MKTLVIALALMCATNVMAQGGGTPNTAPAAPAAVKAKVDRKAARAECLKENKGIKGEKLKECIKSKTL